MLDSQTLRPPHILSAICTPAKCCSFPGTGGTMCVLSLPASLSATGGALKGFLQSKMCPHSQQVMKSSQLQHKTKGTLSKLEKTCSIDGLAQQLAAGTSYLCTQACLLITGGSSRMLCSGVHPFQLVCSGLVPVPLQQLVHSYYHSFKCGPALQIIVPAGLGQLLQGVRVPRSAVLAFEWHLGLLT